jgi:hypothetical protein
MVALPEATKQRGDRHGTEKTNDARHSDRNSINHQCEVTRDGAEQDHTEAPSGQEIEDREYHFQHLTSFQAQRRGSDAAD